MARTLWGQEATLWSVVPGVPSPIASRLLAGYPDPRKGSKERATALSLGGSKQLPEKKPQQQGSSAKNRKLEATPLLVERAQAWKPGLFAQKSLEQMLHKQSLH